jgi:hypothetical protein
MLKSKFRNFSLWPLAFSLCFSASAADVTFHLSDFGAAALNKKSFRLTSLSTPRTAGGRIIVGDTKAIATDAAGDVTTNLVYGNYRIDLAGGSPLSPTTSFLILVPDTSDALDAGDLIVSSISVPGGSVSYSATVSDGKYVARTNGTSTGQALRSPTFAGSTNAFTFTNGVTAGQVMGTDGTNWFAVDEVNAGSLVAITSINGDTNAAQTLVTSESGSDFAIATAGGTNTFSLPIASASNTGKLSAADYSTFYSKQPGTANGTNWSQLSTNALTAKQDASDNLTNWSEIATSTKQPASDNLTNWSALATSAKQDTLGFTPQATNSNLTLWSALAPSAKQDALGFTPVNRAGDTMSAGGATNRFDGFVGNAAGLTNIPESGVTSLVSDLAGKQASLGYTPLNVASNLSDVANSATARNNIGAGTGNGSVTSVAQTVPSQFAVSGSPLTASGTLAITLTNATGTSNSAVVLATAPAISGATLSGVTTNTSTFSGTLTNTGNAGISGVLTVGSGLTSASSNLIGQASALNSSSTAHHYNIESTESSSATSGPQLNFFENDGAALASGDRLGAFQWSGGSSSSATRAGAYLIVYASQNWTNASNYGTRMSLWNCLNGATSPTERMTLEGNGLISFGGSTASFPAIKRNGTAANFRLADDSADAPITASTGGFSGAVSAASLVVTNGVSSLDTTAAVNIASTGWTNTFGKNARVNFDGTGMTFTVFNTAGTAQYTNTLAHTGSMEIGLQTAGKITITGTGVVGMARTF